MKKHTTLRLVRDQSEFKLEVGRGGGGGGGENVGSRNFLEE